MGFFTELLSEMGKFVVSSGPKESTDSRDSAGTVRTDSYGGTKGGESHEHAWSKTPACGDGSHQEGWHGENFKK
jgi:hypothetical protein